MSTPGRIAVVSFLASDGSTVRGLRTQRVVASLRRRASVEVVEGRGHPKFSMTPLARLWRLLAKQVVLDHLEIGARWQLRKIRWDSYDAALLIGYPYSPMILAADRLAESGVPYVVDIGDPWVLTAPRAWLPPAALRRARAAEHRLWERAAAGIVTTQEQAKRLREHFPDLSLLIRPNGVDVPESAVASPSRVPDSTLRIAHYGGIYGDRLSVADWLNHLGRSGLWREIQLHQYGDVWATHVEGLVRSHPRVQVEFHDQQPWPQIVRGSVNYDVALVVGFNDTSRLPSKAITYQTLPIPKVALVASRESGALGAFAADRPDWLTATPGTRPSALAAFLEGRPNVSTSVPATDQWDSVADELATFVLNSAVVDA